MGWDIVLSESQLPRYDGRFYRRLQHPDRSALLPVADPELHRRLEQLDVHEQAPLTDGNDVYMETKTGSYNSCNPVGDWTNGTTCGPNSWNTMIWNETRYTWENHQLVQIWSFASDWKPEPNGTNFNQGYGGLEGWEPVFHAVDANSFIYVPGAAGTVWKVDKNLGTSTSAMGMELSI